MRSALEHLAWDLSARLVRRVTLFGRTLSHRGVTGCLDEPAKFRVRHGMLVHPKAIGRHAMREPLLRVELIRAYQERAPQESKPCSRRVNASDQRQLPGFWRLR